MKIKREITKDVSFRNKITLLSFMLAISVIIRHTCNIDVYKLQNGIVFWLERILLSATSISVPAFFLISGFLFFRSYEPSKLFDKFKRRFFGICIPYLVWNILAYLFYVFLTYIPFISEQINTYVEPLSIQSILLNAIWGYHNITWFLRNLMVYIIISPILYCTIRKKVPGILIISAILAVGWIFHSDNIMHFIYYLLGAYISLNYEELAHIKYNWNEKLLAYIILVISILGIAIIGEISSGFMHILHVIQVIALWIIGDCFLTEKTLKWWVQISFFIYCSHRMILESVEKIFLIVLGKSDIAAFIDLMLAPCISLLIIFGIAWFLRKEKILWRILTGNRG